MLGQKPPMGWNTWNTFADKISEELIMQTADAMVSTGLKDAGYEYVVVDDSWSKRERENGKIVADPVKFPHGMKYIADYVHSKGLKFGMYGDVGTMTCMKYPGSLGYETVDAEMFAEIGVDYLKMDYCNKPDDVNGEMCYHRMSMALKATGRDIILSGCNCGDHNAKMWMRAAGAHLYRSTYDIGDSFSWFTGIASSQISELGLSGPGCWNDMDMLTVGMYMDRPDKEKNTTDAYRLHFAWWAMFMSPLMIGCDIRNMSDDTKAILLNKDIIAIDQDEEGTPAFLVGGYRGKRMTFFRHLSGGEYALMFVNLEDEFNEKMHVEFCDLGLTGELGYGLELHDIYDNKDLGSFKEGFTDLVPAKGCKIYRARLVKA
ncbi:MAG: glycoside hydrolase family 27 protein [Eubacteriales bacterium]